MRIRLTAVVAISIAAVPSQGRAQGVTSTGFVVTLGDDTVAVESLTRTPREITGVSIVRAPRTTARRYSIALQPDGSPARIELSFGPPGEKPTRTQRIEYTDDSVHVTFTRPQGTQSLAVAAAGRPLPFFEDIFGAWELALRSLPAAATGLNLLAGRRTIAYRVSRPADGRVVLDTDDSDFGPIGATVDAGGNLLRFDMTGTTVKYVVVRTPGLDVDALAAAFAARDQQGAGLGALSPRDTVRAEIGDATIMIDYGRPSLRGRKVFGTSLAPWETVWRTGANEATQLITSADLEIGGVLVPAGTYSLWTIPSPTGWKLIINRQHGQWGTAYDRTRDLARIDLPVRRLDTPVERLTFRITPAGDGGMLALAWEQIEASIPFRIR